MQFDVFTLLPEVFPPYLDSSILQRARQSGLIDVHIHNIRDYARDQHHITDDTPYAGGQAKPYQIRQFLGFVEQYNLELEDEA